MNGPSLHFGIAVFVASTCISVFGMRQRIQAKKAPHRLSAVSASDLFQSDFQYLCEDNPEYASQAGQHAFDGKLQDLSPEAFSCRMRHNDEVMSTARQILDSLSHDEQSERDRLHLELFIKNIEDEQKGFELCCHLNPVNSIGYGGVHNNFIEALDWLGDENEDDNFLSRLKAFPGQCEQYKELLQFGVESRCVASTAMVRKVPEQLNTLLEKLDSSKSLICDLLSTLPDERAVEGLECKAKFRAAIADLLTFFTKDYIPHARTSIGCLGVLNGNGAELYAHCLKYHTTTTLTADEIHDIGVNEVARISNRYQTDVMDKLAFKGTFEEFVASCQDTASGQYYVDTGEIIEGYKALCGHIQTILPRYFEKIPASKFEIVELDSATSPAAFYMQGTVDLKRPGKFYVNVSNITKRPKYEMTALALHEAVPGHHLQGSLAIENPNIPPFLRFIEDRRYEVMPARRNIYAAYLEGWALYCEALGEELGLYTTPVELFGRLSMEMMRAVRLVVDTGIHSHGWSIERAIEYMMAKTGMHRHECEAECYRYEAWPGQACAYKIGEVSIWSMRRKAEGILGPKFDIRRFHTCLLENGPMPLDTLGEVVDEWITTQA